MDSYNSLRRKVGMSVSELEGVNKPSLPESFGGIETARLPSERAAIKKPQEIASEKLSIQSKSAEQAQQNVDAQLRERGFGGYSRPFETTEDLLPQTGVGASFQKGFYGAFGAGDGGILSESLEERIQEDDREGMMRAANIGGSLAANAFIYTATRGLLNKVPGLAAKTTFLGKQSIDLLVDNIAQAPQGVIKDINDDKSITEITKNLAVQNVADIAINLTIDGIFNAKKIKDWVKSKSPGYDKITKGIENLEESEKAILRDELGSDAPKQIQDALDKPGKIIEKPNDIFEQPLPGISKAKQEIPGLDLPDKIKPTRLSAGTGKTSVGIQQPKLPGMKIPRKIKPASIETGKGKATSFSLTEPTKAQVGTLKPTTTRVVKNVKNVQDIKGSYYANTLERNIDALGNAELKQNILTPLREAQSNSSLFKQNIEKEMASAIDDSILYDKTARFLVQRYGENKITEDAMIKIAKREGLDPQNIKEATAWFKSTYNKLIDTYNSVARNYNIKEMDYRQDYFRHMSDLGFGDAIQNLKNSTSSVMDDSFGSSGKLLSIMKERKGGKYEIDAVKGFANYVDQISYAIYFNPLAKEFSDLGKGLSRKTSLKRFGEYLKDFSKDLSGGKFGIGEAIEKGTPETLKPVINALSKLNRATKASVIAGNVRSAVLSQSLNTPMAISLVMPQNPKAVLDGLTQSLKSIFDPQLRAVYKESGYLRGRRVSTIFDKYETNILKKGFTKMSEFTQYMDAIYSTNIWNMFYKLGESKGLSGEKLIEYADSLARKNSAGREFGDIPLRQRQELYKIIAPFSLEVSNFWKNIPEVAKELGSTSKILGGIVTYGASSYVINSIIEELSGMGGGYDPVGALEDAFRNFDEEDDNLDKAYKIIGSQIGEAMSNTAFGQYVAAGTKTFLPEQGVSEFFGPEQDPTRFGVGNLPVIRPVKGIVETAQGLLDGDTQRAAMGALETGMSVVAGGGQVMKSVEGYQASTGAGLPIPGSYTNAGNLRTPLDSGLPEIVQSVLFGQYAPEAVQDYFKNQGRPLGENQTKSFISLVSETEHNGIEHNPIDTMTLFDAINEIREEDATKKDERMNILRKYFEPEQIYAIMNEFYSTKKPPELPLPKEE